MEVTGLHLKTVLGADLSASVTVDAAFPVK